MSPPESRSAFAWALAVVAALTFVRLYVVFASGLNLGPDEAQYWFWSKDLAFGYFSKPPMIAWIIAGETRYCGDGEACVRSLSPVIYAIAALLVFGTGQILYGARTGFWACVTFATLPGISFSSGLMTTDVPLLLFWAAALACLALLLKRPPKTARALSIGLGILIGLAMLAKYAGAYFILGLAVASLFDTRVRRHLFGWNGVLMIGAAIVVFAPNIIWNIQHGFATVSHTAYNAGLNGDLFHLDRLGDFALTQFGVFGPIVMTVIIAGLALGLRRGRWPHRHDDDVVLLAISLPVVLIGLGIAFLSKANANWSAPAYVGLSIAAAAWLTRSAGLRWLQASTAIAIIAGGVLYAAVLSPRFTQWIGQTNAFKQVRGWPLQGKAIADTALTGGYGAVLCEDREDIASLLYYTRDTNTRIEMWTDDVARPSDHFQMTRPYRGDPDRVLYVTRRTDPSNVTDRFAMSKEIAINSVTIGQNRTRDFHLYELSGFKPR